MQLGEEGDSEVTRPGTLTAPVQGPCDSSSRPGRDQGWGEVRVMLFEDRVRLHGWLVTLPSIPTSKPLYRHKGCSTQ